MDWRCLNMCLWLIIFYFTKYFVFRWGCLHIKCLSNFEIFNINPYFFLLIQFLILRDSFTALSFQFNFRQFWVKAKNQRRIFKRCRQSLKLNLKKYVLISLDLLVQTKWNSIFRCFWPFHFQWLSKKAHFCSWFFKIWINYL